MNQPRNANLGRRGFLGAMIGACLLDPERLLWVPGKKLISIPKPRPLWAYVIRRYVNRGATTDVYYEMYKSAGFDPVIQVIGSRQVSPYIREETIEVKLETITTSSIRAYPYVMMGLSEPMLVPVMHSISVGDMTPAELTFDEHGHTVFKNPKPPYEG